MEERERLDALLKRKKLLQELGVVDQLHQLLQGRAGGGGVLREASSQQQSKQANQRRQQTKVRTENSYKCGLKCSLVCG